MISESRPRQSAAQVECANPCQLDGHIAAPRLICPCLLRGGLRSSRARLLLRSGVGSFLARDWTRIVTPPAATVPKLTADPTGREGSSGAAEPLDPAVAHAWTEIGLAAHRSVSAHAEFAAQLLRLSAPLSLLHGAARAMLEESALAQRCLALADPDTESDVLLTPAPEAPARSAPRRDAEEVDVSAVVLATLRRGCIAATVDCVCAREALEHCRDAKSREVLSQLGCTRAREAQLAWRFLAWALRSAQHDLADQVRVTILTALRTQPKRVSPGVQERQLLRHGLLSSPQRAAIEQRVLRDIIVPCMEATLARAAAARPSAA